MEEFLKRLKVAFICTGITVVWSTKIIVALCTKWIPNVLKGYSIIILSKIATITNSRYLLDIVVRENEKFQKDIEREI